MRKRDEDMSPTASFVMMVLLAFDGVQVLSLFLGRAFGWDLEHFEWFRWNVGGLLSWAQRPGLAIVLFALAAATVLSLLGLCGWVLNSFHRSQFNAAQQATGLWHVTQITLHVAYIPILQVLLMPARCSNMVLAGVIAEGDCANPRRVGLLAAGVVLAVLLLPVALATALVGYVNTPSARHTFAQTHGRTTVLYTLARTLGVALLVLAVEAGETGPRGVVLVLLAGAVLSVWLSFSQLFNQPHHSMRVNQLRSAVYLGMVWMSCGSLAMYTLSQDGATTDQLRRWVGSGILAGLLLILAIGSQMPHWHMRHLAVVQVPWVLYLASGSARRQRANKPRIRFAADGATPAAAVAEGAEQEGGAEADALVPGEEKSNDEDDDDDDAAAAAAAAVAGADERADDSVHQGRSFRDATTPRAVSLDSEDLASFALVNAHGHGSTVADDLHATFANSKRVEIWARAVLIDTVPPMPSQDVAKQVVMSRSAGGGRFVGASAPLLSVAGVSGPARRPDITPAMWRKWYYLQVAQNHIPKWNVDRADSVYQAGLRAFPDDPWAYVSYATFISTYHQNPLRATVVLNKAKKLKPALDLAITETDLAKRLEEMRQAANLGNQEALDTVGVIAFRQQQRHALSKHRAAVSLIADLWRKVKESRHKLQVNHITRRLGRITAAKEGARISYEAMLHRFPTSLTLLRSYGAFVSTVLHEPDLAAKVYLQIRMLEEAEVENADERQRMLNSGHSPKPDSSYGGRRSESRHGGTPMPGPSGARTVSSTASAERRSAESQIKPRVSGGNEIMRYSITVQWGIVLVAALVIGMYVLFQSMLVSFEENIHVIDDAGIRRAFSVNLLYSTRALVARSTAWDGGADLTSVAAGQARLRTAGKLLRTVHTKLYLREKSIPVVQAAYRDPAGVEMVQYDVGPPPRSDAHGMTYLDAVNTMVSQATEVANLNPSILVADQVIANPAYRSVCDNDVQSGLAVAFAIVELWNDYLYDLYIPLVSSSTVTCCVIVLLICILVFVVFGNSLLAVQRASRGIPDVVSALSHKAVHRLVGTYGKVKKALQDFTEDLEEAEEGASDRGLSDSEAGLSSGEDDNEEGEEVELRRAADMEGYPRAAAAAAAADAARHRDHHHASGQGDNDGLLQPAGRQVDQLAPAGVDRTGLADRHTHESHHHTHKPRRSAMRSAGRRADAERHHSAISPASLPRGVDAAVVEGLLAPSQAPGPRRQRVASAHSPRGAELVAAVRAAAEPGQADSDAGDKATTPLRDHQANGQQVGASNVAVVVAATPGEAKGQRLAGSPPGPVLSPHRSRRHRRAHILSDVEADPAAMAPAEEEAASAADREEEGESMLRLCVTGCAVWGPVLCKDERRLASSLRHIAVQVLLAALLAVAMQGVALGVQIDLLQKERFLASSFNLAGQRRMFTLSVHTLTQEVLMADEQVMPLGVSVLMLRSAVDHLRDIHSALRFGSDEYKVKGINRLASNIDATSNSVDPTAFGELDADTTVDVQLANAGLHGVDSIVQLYLARADSVLARFEPMLDAEQLYANHPEMEGLRWGYDTIPRILTAEPTLSRAEHLNRDWTARSLQLQWNDSALAEATYDYFTEAFDPRLAGIVGPNLTALMADPDFEFIARMNLEVAGSAMQAGVDEYRVYLSEEATRANRIKFAVLALNLTLLFALQLFVFRRMFARLRDEAGRTEDLLRLIPIRFVIDLKPLHQFFNIPEELTSRKGGSGGGDDSAAMRAHSHVGAMAAIAAD